MVPGLTLNGHCAYRFINAAPSFISTDISSGLCSAKTDTFLANMMPRNGKSPQPMEFYAMPF